MNISHKSFFTLLILLFSLLICQSCNNEVSDSQLSQTAFYYYTGFTSKAYSPTGEYQPWRAIDIKTREDYSIAMGMIDNSALSVDQKNSYRYLLSLNNQELCNSKDWYSYKPKAVSKNSEYKLGFTNCECAVATTVSALKRMSKMSPEPRPKDTYIMIPDNQLVYIGKVYGEYCNIVIIDENPDYKVYVAKTLCINERTIIE